METVNNVMKMLKEKHTVIAGQELNLEDDVYYIFLKDAVISIWKDDDAHTLKFDIEMLPENNTFVYFENKTLDEIL